MSAYGRLPPKTDRRIRVAEWMLSGRELTCNAFGSNRRQMTESDNRYWTLRHLPTARGLGCELDPQVYELTARNLQILGLPVRVENWEYRSVLVREAAAKEELVVAFIAPPWGKALDPKTGLNLLATLPPIPEILEQLHHAFSGKRVLCAIQVSEVIEPRSL